MSLYGVMRTGGSGMNAQSNKLATVADNIANVNTTGYKRASTEFSSFILRSGTGNYNSGSVETQVRYAISDPGTANYTTSATDMMIQGNGFFVVSDAGGTPYLTRAGSFVPDGQGTLQYRWLLSDGLQHQEWCPAERRCQRPRQSRGRKHRAAVLAGKSDDPEQVSVAPTWIPMLRSAPDRRTLRRKRRSSPTIILEMR